MKFSAAKHFNIKCCGVMAILAVLCGCTGPARILSDSSVDKSELATIYPWSRYFRGVSAGIGFIPVPVPKQHNISVIAIDGLELVRSWFYFHGEIKVKAGHHSVKLLYERTSNVVVCIGWGGCVGSYTKELSIDFVAEGGHEYKIMAYVPDEREWVWVEDTTAYQSTSYDQSTEDAGTSVLKVTPAAVVAGEKPW